MTAATSNGTGSRRFSQTGSTSRFLSATCLSPRLRRAAELLHVAVRGHWDGAALTFRSVVERAGVGPAAALVEPPSSGVAGHDGQPRRRVAGGPDLPLRVLDEPVGHARAAMAGGHVDLLDLVADDHGEAGDLAADHGDGGVADAPGGPGPEGVLLPGGGQLRGHVAEVAVPPAEVPDRRDRRRVLRQGWA